MGKATSKKSFEEPFVGSARRYRLRRWRADVAGARPDEAVVSGLFHDVGAPSNDASSGERRGEHVAADPTCVHDDSGVELDVGVKFTPRLQLGERLFDGLFDVGGEAEEWCVEVGGKIA
jgi:hypothetical protein